LKAKKLSRHQLYRLRKKAEKNGYSNLLDAVFAAGDPRRTRPIGFDEWAKVAEPNATYRVLAIPDLQVPYHDEAALDAVLKYAVSERWDEVVIMGDFMDLDCISSHNKGKPRLVEGKDVARDYEVGRRVLGEILRAVRERNPHAAATLLEGNHEHRAEKYIDEHPEMRGSIEVESCLRLSEQHVKYVRCYAKGDVHEIGKATFTHGIYHGQNAAKKHAEAFGRNVFFGHTHSVESWSVTRYGSDETYVGQSLGCLCRYEQGYIGKNPTKWQHAVGEFTFWPDGYFSYAVHRIFRNRFAVNGRVFDAA